jgi:hypothetical protein
MPKDDTNIGPVPAPRKPKALEVATPEWVDTCLQLGLTDRFSMVVMITVEVALYMLGFNTHNRPFHAATIEKYVALIKDSEWMLTFESIAFSYNGILINGQHRLMAIIRAGVPVPLTVWFGCEPEEFQVIDIPDVRTPADMGVLSGLDHATSRSTLARYVLRFERRVRSSPSVKVHHKMLEMAKEDLYPALRAGHRIYHHRIITRAAGVLAYYWIEKNTKQPDKLPTYWEEITTGALLPQGAIALRFREWLRTGFPSGYSQDRAFKEAAFTVLVWNTWLKGNKKLPRLDWPHALDLPEVD